jgi:hypothetical protein
MRQAVHVAHSGEKKLHIEFWCKNLMEIDHFKELGMANRMTLKHISNK